jgi:prolyl-tRNA synthetase
VAAIAEQNADVDGLLWPATVAPFDATVVCLNAAQDIEVAEEVYGMLQEAGISVLLDDRDERAGVKFKDADLIGIPLQIVVGRGARDGWVELRVRGRDVREEVAVTDIAERTEAMRRALISELDRAAAEAEAAAR